MKINVSISGPLRKPSGESELTLNIEKNKDIKEILIELGYKDSEIEHMMCFLNDKPVSLDTVPKDKDNIFLTILVGGG